MKNDHQKGYHNGHKGPNSDYKGRDNDNQDARLGDLLDETGSITSEQRAIALARKHAGDPRPLGVILVELGFVTPADIELALMRQQARQGRFAHADTLRVLHEAWKSTRSTAVSFDELALAALELGKGGAR